MVRAGTSLDVIEVDAASHGLVDDIRRLRDLALYATPGSCRVVLLDEAHSMGRAAFDAVLKILEEPPDRTVFILLTTEPGRIPRTVASRCMPFSFRRVAPAVIQQRLAEICEREQISAEPGLLAAISSRADGGVRDAVMLLDQCWAAGAATEEHLCQLTGEDDFAPNLIAAMLEPALLYRELGAGGLLDRLGDYQLIGTRLVGCLRDILVLHAGGEVTAQGTPLEARRSLAARLTGGQVVSAMSVLWSLRTKVRAGSDSRSGLELALVMASEALRPKAEAAVMNGFGNGNGHRPITLAELQAASAPLAPA
jgi:DNA polymerase-3 subunit gamma/tau